MSDSEQSNVSDGSAASDAESGSRYENFGFFLNLARNKIIFLRSRSASRSRSRSGSDSDAAARRNKKQKKKGGKKRELDEEEVEDEQVRFGAGSLCQTVLIRLFTLGT